MSKLKILYIDDDEYLLYGMAKVLYDQGYEVFVCADSYEGLEMIKTKQPDLIICDILMPELSGFAIKRIINTDVILRNIPFVFLTGLEAKEDIEYALSLRACDCFLKPVKLKEFFNFLKSVLKDKNE